MLKRLIGLEHVPLYRLVLGTACAWALTLGIPIWLAVTPTFDKEQPVTIEGKIVEVESLRMQEGTVVDFSVRDQTIRFRVAAGIFRVGWHERVPSEFRPGAVARVQVFHSEYLSPYSPVPYRVPTVT